MNKLAQILLVEGQKDAVVADFVRLIEGHVAERSGLKGMGLRAGLKMLKAAKPGIVERATAKFLPDFLAALDPLYQKFNPAKDKDFSVYLQKHVTAASTALLKTADLRVENASPTFKSYYAKFRDGSEPEVQKLVPRLGALVQKYLA